MSKDAARFDRRAAPALGSADVARAVERLSGQVVSGPVRRLGGGFSNSNYAVSCGANAFVLRVHRQPRVEVEKELAVLELCAARGVRVPRVVGADLESGPHPLSLSEWLPGVSLATVLWDPARRGELEGLLREASAQLAAIHRIELAGPGLLGGRELEVTLPFASFATDVRAYVERALEERAGPRLGSSRERALRALIESRWPSDALCTPQNRLVHADYNPKNLHVGDGGALAVLDWEFAFCGSPLFDLGNLLRFPEDYPALAADWIATGYRAAGGSLPEGWREACAILDLLNLCQFLNAEEERPRTFRTALGRIDRLLST